MTFDENHWPPCCPFGHPLRPGGSLSWDMELHRHWLLCGACDRRTGIVLGEQEWQVYVGGRWVPHEG